MKASYLSCALAALLPVLAWAQAPSRQAVPAQAPALPPAAREAVQQAQQGCQSDGYEPELCEKAIAALEAAARQHPAQIEVQLALAQAYWNRSFQERPESPSRERWQRRSTDIYQRMVDRKVADARPYYELSVREEDPAERMPLLRRAVELDPRHPRANQDLAWGLLRQGQTDEAWRVYQNHLKASPVKDRQEAQENLRFAGALARAQRPKQAAQVVETVMDQMKDERRAERCLLAQSVDPRLMEARPATKRELQELRPYCTNTEHLDRAVELEQQGRTDEAITELERQVDANPKPEETYVMLERLYMRKGQTDKAAEVTTRYLRSEPDAREKCERFQRISPRTLRAMDTATLEAVRRECARP
ncbi:MAG: tetratricopeptide repeat protein [Myxococcaceae bacterium]|nr:tetratricopeptide repeat protein [Myxococcaceae bacterium]